MSKYQIFIDFEAVDRSLIRVLKYNIDFLPFCYTIGMYNDKNEFVTETSILDFKKLTTRNVYYLLAEQLKKDIKKLTNDPDLVIKNNTVRFVGWNPFLENKITTKIFKITTFPQVKYDGVSLDTITRHGNFMNNYFSSVAAIESKNKLHVRTVKFNKPGYTASYVGFILLRYYKRMSLYKLKIDESVIKSFEKDMKVYSKDDVVKMHYVHTNYVEICKKINKIKMLRKKIQDNNANLKNYSIFVLYLKGIFKLNNASLDDVIVELKTLITKIKSVEQPSCLNLDLKINIEIAQIYKLINLIEKAKAKYADLERLYIFINKKINKFKSTIIKDKENLEITLFKE